MAGNSGEPGRTVASKVTAILMTFSSGRVLSMSEIGRLAGIPLSTAHRLVSELVAWRILERTQDGDYRIGLPLLMIGDHALSAPNLLQLAPAAMGDLSGAIGCDVRLGVLNDLEVSYIEKPVGHRAVVSGHATLPAHATALGKALLAFASPEIVDLVIARGLKAYTPHTLTSGDQLRRALAVTRMTRIAVSKAEFKLEVSAVAAPVFGPGGNVVAALEIELRDLRSRFLATKAALTVAACSLGRQLATGRPDARLSGWTVPNGSKASTFEPT